MRRAVWLIGALGGAAVGVGLVLAATGRGEADRTPAADTDHRVVSEAQRPAGTHRNVVERDDPGPAAGLAGPGAGAPNAEPDVHAGDPRVPLSSDDVWADLADPANSGLPPDVFRAAARTASAVVVADTTGEGRDRWPDHWHGAPAGRCCRTVTIHAAGARRHPRHPGDVQAAVIWSGQARPGVGGTFREETTQLRLTPDDTGEWRPAR